MRLLLGSQVGDDVRYIEGEDFRIEAEELAIHWQTSSAESERSDDHSTQSRIADSD